MLNNNKSTFHSTIFYIKKSLKDENEVLVVEGFH